MNRITVKCFYCSKKFQRERRRYNEAKKIGWNQYCSKKCQRKSKITEITKVCGNPECNKKVSRQFSQFQKSKSGLIFCSISCAAIFHNLKRRKAGVCLACGKEFFGERKYCSKTCLSNALKGTIKVAKIDIINEIKKFYKNHQRIPLKREFHHCKAARLRFGTWNNAIQAAEFDPNPVMFAKKYVARDGHGCDSLSEKIIDDWLSRNNLEHKINVSYPKNPKLTCDFVVDKYFIEFFGLEGEQPRYTELVEVKRKLAQQHNLSLIELKPGHLFPKNKLNIVLDFLLKNN